MKKFVTLAVALLLSIAFAMFAGCSTALEKGKIEGNYKEPTQEELETALLSLEGSTLFGDTEQADWEFGVKTGGNFNVKITVDESTLSADAKVSLQEKISKSETGLELLGKGNLSFNMKAPKEFMGEETDVGMEAEMYNDSSFLYLEASAKSGKDSQDVKVKVDISTIMGELMFGEAMNVSAAGILAETGDQESASATLGFSVKEFMEFAAKWNLDIGLDTSDGVKLRLTASQETFTKILNAVLKKIMSLPASASFDMSDRIALSNSVFELYLQTDKDGKFVAAATNLTLKGSIEIPAMTEDSEATNIGIDIGGAFYIESNLSDFSIPDGISEDSSYQVIDDSFFN